MLNSVGGLRAPFLLSRLKQEDQQADDAKGLYEEPGDTVDDAQLVSRVHHLLNVRHLSHVHFLELRCLLIVTVLVAYSFSVAAYHARKRRLAWDASTGAREEDLYVTSMGRPRGLDRFRTVVQIALMVGVVAAGFVLLAVLVLVMSWHGY